MEKTDIVVDYADEFINSVPRRIAALREYQIRNKSSGPSAEGICERLRQHCKMKNKWLAEEE